MVEPKDSGSRKAAGEVAATLSWQAASAVTHSQHAMEMDEQLDPLAKVEHERRSLGRFELRGVLGRGAFGTVYRAHDPQLDRDVALKIPRRDVAGDPHELQRFLREARAAGGPPAGCGIPILCRYSMPAWSAMSTSSPAVSLREKQCGRS